MQTLRIWSVVAVAVVAACGGTQHASPADATTSMPVDASDAATIAPDAAGSGSATSGVYLVDEEFDAMSTAAAPTAPWMVATSPGGAVTVTDVPFAGDKSVELAKPDATGTSSLSIDVGPHGGRVVFEAKVMARETAGFKAIPYIYDGSGNTVASISFQDGAINAHVGATTTMIQPFVANVWYRVRVVVDTSAGTFDLYIDGIRMEHSAALRTASASVQRATYYMDGANTGTLFVDSVQIYTEAAFIGAPPSPVFDPRDYGATGDGVTNDTAAIQAAIGLAAGTGGSVVLSHGTFASGTLTLGSKMTFFIDPTAVLLGSTAVADYPAQSPATGNTQLSNTQRALLYAPAVDQLTIDGGGVIDGQGDSFSGVENTRPLLVWTVLSSHVAIKNLYLHKGAVWSLVTMESDHVLIDHIQLQSNFITHDGIDVVDGTDITVENSAINAGDDAMCLKTGVRRGIDTMVVKHSMFSGNNGGSNGIKFGTATYGAFKNITIESSYVKNVQYAAMALESRQGADVEGVSFQRIGFANVGAAFFVYLAQQATTHPIGDVPKLGTIDHVSFTDIAGTTASWPHSPHQGSLITGHVFDGVTYPITNLTFTRVAVGFAGGSTSVPATPPEATPNQYPESNMFGDLPAWGYYLRHVAGVTFDACTSSLATTDARQELVASDVSGQVGAPQ